MTDSNPEPPNVHRARLAPLAAELLVEGAPLVEELVALHDRCDAIESQQHHDRDVADLQGRAERLIERLLGMAEGISEELANMAKDFVKRLVQLERSAPVKG